MSNINKILSEGEEGFTEEDYLHYLNQELSPEEAHLIEKEMLEDGFVNDAMEGLSAIKSKEAIEASVENLNRQLNKIVQTRIDKKRKRKLPSNQWAIIAVGITLVLIIITFYIIHLYH